MGNPNPVQSDQFKESQYKTQGDALLEPLENKDTKVKVPVDVATAIRKLPNQAAWLRRVIAEAAIKEGLAQAPGSD